MIKKLWQKIAGKKSTAIAAQMEAVATAEPLVLTRDQHSVSRKLISDNALKVLYRLNNAGYEAYLVGGGVRDILLGLAPKDFDIATNATPEEIGKLFRNSRLIGRRFRLAHILFGREVIEVATFRADHTSSHSSHAKTSEAGMLVRDNVYGNLEEDAFRRDFTVNALYYSAENFALYDFADGLKDLKNRQLRLIGDPETRYREDPVRILRAIRLASKLDLQIEASTAAPIKVLAEMLEHISSARLWDESSKLFLAGYAEDTWRMMQKFDVARHLFKQTVDALKHDPQQNFERFIEAALKSTDRRIQQQQPVNPGFLFAVFLWQPMQTLVAQMIAKGIPAYEANQKASVKVMDMQRKSIAIPKRFSVVAYEMWALQFRLTNRRKRSVDSLIQNQRFRAAYDFLCLRALDNPELTELANWWTQYQDANAEQQNKLLKAVATTTGPKKSNKRRKPTKKKISPSKTGQPK